MKLKKLTIIGFKSFADKISIDFDCEIVAIVGPNGCGKSNIVDAFRWVLGEQSAKSMRAEKMQDVLFAGNDKRKPNNYAEVTVDLTDVSQDLKTPYDEITITRRLYITGESEYLINRQPARLKDIQDFFMGTGLGKHAFSVFEQGKLDQIINLRPQERRLIFDEAAGIGRFLSRKKETLSKLSQVTENYNRIKDLHVEIEKETRILKRQAEKALGFKENKEKLFALEKKVYLKKWKKAFEHEIAMSSKLTHLQNETKIKKEVILRLEKEAERLKKTYFVEEKNLQIKQRALFEKKADLEFLKREKAEIKTQLLDLEKKEKALKEEIQTLHTLRKEDQTKLEEEKSLLLKLENEKNRYAKEEAIELKKKEEIEKKIESHRQKIRQGEKEELQAIKEEKALDFQLQENQLKMSAKKERFQNCLAQLKEKEEKISHLENEITLFKEKSASLSLEIDELKKRAKSSEIALKEHYGKIEKKKEAKAELIQKITENGARKEILLKLKEQYEGFSSGAKKLLLEAKNPKSAFYSKITPLFEAMSAKKGYEKALGAALLFYSDTLVVKDQNTLKDVLSFAKKNQLTHFSILSLDLLKNEKKLKNGLLKHIEPNVLSNHFFRNIELAEELQEDFLSKENVVTKEGEFLDHNFVLFKRKGEDIFQRESEIKEILRLEEELKKEEEKLDAKIETLLKEAKEKEDLRKEGVELHRKKEIFLFKDNFSLQLANQNLESEKKEKHSLEKEIAGLKETEEELLIVEKLTEEKKRVQKNLTLILNVIEKEEKALQEIENEMKEQLKKLEERQKLSKNAFQEWQKLDHEMRVNFAKEVQNEKLIKKCERDLLELCQIKNTKEKLIQEKEEGFLIKEMELESLSQAFHMMEERLNAQLKENENQEKKLSEERALFNVLEKEEIKIELQSEEIKAKKKGLEESLQSKFAVSEEEKCAFIDRAEESLNSVEEMAAKLRYELEKEDRINFAAIEEYKEKEARFLFYEKQLSDLDESKKDLEKIITKLEADSRKLFKKAFQEIRHNFQKNFSILFKGGEADLRFTDSSDILEAGIEILAKPPGKNMRAISLLSGGEKCLTALSLLFAIFETRAAPFCILDEVDAPLDDSNVGLFAKMLKQFTARTQFIVVTHNKKTMAFADLLLGVSMEEKGVSNLISLSFEKKYETAVL